VRSDGITKKEPHYWLIRLGGPGHQAPNLDQSRVETRQHHRTVSRR